MKTAVVLTIAVLAISFANVCLAKGMQGFDSTGLAGANWLPEAAFHVVSNPWMIGGVLLLGVFLAAYLTALSWADLSFVLPATAPSYILTAGLAKFFLNEAISPARWGGTFLIVAGTCLVARSYTSCRTEPERKPAAAPWAKELPNAPGGAEPRSSGRLHP